MPTEFRLPELGEDVESGQVTRVLVQAGDTIEAEQSVIELETDKATVEVPCGVAGMVKEIRVKEGDEIRSGDVILIVEEGGEEPAEAARGQGGAKEKAAAAEEAQAPAPEQERQEAQEGRAVAKGVAPQEARPEQVEAAARAEEEVVAPPAREAARRGAGLEAEEMPAVNVRAAPSVRRFAREAGVDVSRVPPGPGGRVSREDVERYLSRQEEMAQARRLRAAPAASLPDFGKWGPVRREPMSAIRRRIAEHMALCWSQIPHVTQHDRADVTALEKMRRQLAPKVEEAGAKLTVTVIAVKVAAAALQAFPKFNASLDADAGEIIYKDYRHVGVAVATDQGLLVPVIRDADRKGLMQIARELSELARKARDGKIAPQELKGGTFTITNVGGIGGTYFTPIVNFPQVAILGIGRAYEEHGHDDPPARLWLPLSLSYDHRVIDGAEGARFLGWIAETLEAPLALALED